MKRALVSNIFSYIVLSLVLLGGSLYFLYRADTGIKRTPWIKAENTAFIKEGKPFRFIGANAVNIVFYDDWGLDIEKAIRAARENNISVLRIYLDWGWAKDEDIDRIIDISRRNRIHLILTLTDCCCSGNYASLEKYFYVHAPFCNLTNKQCILAFKRRIRQIITRRNSVNGIIYRDDPTILAWEIANELEYQRFSHGEVKHWIEEISKYIKSLDGRHLLTIGLSIGESDLKNYPRLPRLFDAFNIDFFSVHFYASSRQQGEPVYRLKDNYPEQLRSLVDAFLMIGKPVIIGEFGLSDSGDFNYKMRKGPQSKGRYSSVFKEAMDAAFSAGASGVMFWGWGVPEEKCVPMWWNNESHNQDDKEFCFLLRNYVMPQTKYDNGRP